MSTLWSFLLTLISSSPWIIMALAAGWALYKRRESKILLLQAGGAGGMFLLTLVKWIVLRILNWMAVGNTIWNATNSIFGFLIFVSLAAFAAGYCIERFYNRKTITVSATPVK